MGHWGKTAGGSEVELRTGGQEPREAGWVAEDWESGSLVGEDGVRNEESEDWRLRGLGLEYRGMG